MTDWCKVACGHESFCCDLVDASPQWINDLILGNPALVFTIWIFGAIITVGLLHSTANKTDTGFSISAGILSLIIWPLLLAMFVFPRIAKSGKI
jgi:hypothetical protein